jgi:hypothetical protein
MLSRLRCGRKCWIAKVRSSSGKRVASRAGADLEHAILRPDRGGRGHLGDDQRLRDRLTFGDRQRRVLVREFLKALRHEGLARHAPHRVENARVADAARLDLAFEHALPFRREIEHANVASEYQMQSAPESFSSRSWSSRDCCASRSIRLENPLPQSTVPDERGGTSLSFARFLFNGAA